MIEEQLDRRKKESPSLTKDPEVVQDEIRVFFAGGPRSPKGNESGRSDGGSWQKNRQPPRGNTRQAEHLIVFHGENEVYEPILPSSLPSAFPVPPKRIQLPWKGRGTISFFLPDQFEIACPFSGRTSCYIYIYVGQTCAPKPASPGFKFSKLDDWPFREWNLLTNSEDGSTIQLLCGEISN